MTGIPFDKKSYGYYVATDGSGLVFRGEEPPNKVEATRLGGTINIATEFETIELERLEYVRAVSCVGKDYASHAVYTIYLNHEEFSRRGPGVVIAENHGGANHTLFVVDALDARQTYLALAAGLFEGDLWTLLSSVTDAVDCARVRGRNEVVHAFREGRMKWTGRGSTRRVVLEPAK